MDTPKLRPPAVEKALLDAEMLAALDEISSEGVEVYLERVRVRNEPVRHEKKEMR
ncbi:MAG: hypothetical protein GY835_22855 [bacterium]|nr:hypothetical protein [bacterium]